MRLSTQSTPGNGFNILASFVLVAAVLYFAKDIFVPLALAALLTFLLAPLVVRLTRWGLGKALSVLVVVIFAFSVIGILGWGVTTQVIQLAEELPNYQQNLQAKIVALKKPNREGVLSKTTEMVKQLQKEIESTEPEPEADGAGGAEPVETPVPVEIKAPMAAPLQVIGSIVGPVLKPLATAGAAVFFVILMLFQREDLRERFLKLVSRGELNIATQAVDDAGQRVSRYLVMQLIVNATYGIPVGVGLYFIGVPNAFLWGILATLLRFIPFLGPWIAASFPIVLAFAVDPGWTMPLMTVGLFLVLELISNNLVEPLLYGSSTGVSNIALLVAAIFWTWLWGPVGLLLSAPLTVCLLVLGKYVPGLGFLNILLGSDPVLEPAVRFYQRMLAMDEDEILRVADKFESERPLAELYDTVVLPALSLAEQDRHKGTLAEVRQAFIVQNIRELIESLGERNTPDQPGQAEQVTAKQASAAVLCIPARDDADELAAAMLVQLVEKQGIPARVVPAKSLATEWLKQIRDEGIGTVCVSAVPPFAIAPARQICKRLKQELPNLKLIIGIWDAKAHATDMVKRLATSCPEALVTRLSDAVVRIEEFVEAQELARRRGRERPSEPQLPSAAPVAELEIEPDEIFASVTRQAAKVLNVPVSLVSFIDTDREFWKSHGGIPPDFATGDRLRESSLCTGAPLAEDFLHVEDVSKDRRFASDALLQERGIRFYAGVPLRTSDGHVVGALCVTDTEPHQVSDRAKALLRSLGDRLIQVVESRKPVDREEPLVENKIEAAVPAAADRPLRGAAL